MTIRFHKNYIMLGSPEVLQMGKNMIKLIKARRILDIGSLCSIVISHNKKKIYKLKRVQLNNAFKNSNYFMSKSF